MEIGCNQCGKPIGERSLKIAEILEAKKAHEMETGHYPQTTHDMIETIPGTKVIGQRLAQAEEGFIASLMELGGLTYEQAEHVFALYLKLKIVKAKGLGIGRYNVVHGAYLDKETLQKAAATPFPTKKQKVA